MTPEGRGRVEMRATAFFLGIVLLALAFAGAALSGEEATDDPEEIDEVVVTAPLQKLRELRAAIEDAEDRFYERYNRLNTDDDFDIECTYQVRGTTRTRERICEAKYIVEVKAADALEIAQVARTCGVERRELATHGGCGYIPMANTIAQGRAPEARAKMLEVINRDRELRRMAQEREELERRYEEMRKEKFKDRVIVFE